jgi:predicted amidophosphoribosyltransferase
MERERRTVEAMIGIYCRGAHGTHGGLCDECEALRAYAGQRLEKCPFQEAKTTCAKCPIHCYKPEMRERVRVVMRYAGPRMIYKHPLLAILHLLDGRRAAPDRDLAANISRRRRSQHPGG